MMKRLFRVFLLCFPLLLLLSVHVFAVSDSGKWGDNITWKLSDNGVLTLSGTGAMASAKEGFPSSSWYKHSKEIQTIVIQEGITSIGDLAFTTCANLTGFTLSSTVTSIGESAFLQCSKLTEITIPGTVEKIGGWAFNHCSALKKATLQDGVKELGIGVFSSCDNLTEISIPASVTTIGDERNSGLGGGQIKIATFPAKLLASLINSTPHLEEVTIIGNAQELPDRSFLNVLEYDNLKKVTILDGVTVIGEDLFFSRNKLTAAYLPHGLTTIKTSAFANCPNLADCVIPDSVTSIGDNAFSFCTSLRKVIIPSGVQTIANHAFFATRLDELYIPVGVTKIEEYAFGDSRDAKTDQVRSQLKDVYYEGSEAQWKQIDMGNYNYLLSDATIHYNSEMPPIILPTPTAAPAPVTVTDNETSFTDVSPNAYYADAVKWAVENGVTKGVSETSFAPDDTCTRGQVATFLWRAKGSPEPATAVNPFTDVDPSSAFYKAILWASENGITSGTSPTTFSPANPCTRAHVITFLWRSRGEPSASGDTPLTDSFPAGYYTNAVKWAESAGLLSGTGETFAPSALCPRADIVEYLYRVLK